MVGLILASIWTWTIIIGHAIRIHRAGRGNAGFEREFWKAQDIDKFYEARGREDLPSAKIFAAGIAEWRRSTSGARIDKDGARSRLAVAMQSAVAAEMDKLAGRLNILATVGSVAPFVGLFGTVWGIMRSFSDIAGANNTSLAVGRARNCRGPVRDRIGPVRGHPGGGRLQSDEPRHQPDGIAAPALRRRLSRHLEPRAGERG